MSRKIAALCVCPSSGTTSFVNITRANIGIVGYFSTRKAKVLKSESFVSSVRIDCMSPFRNVSPAHDIASCHYGMSYLVSLPRGDIFLVSILEIYNSGKHT